VVGAGNKIFAACSLQRTDEPGNRSLWVIDQYGTKQNEIMLTTSNNLNQDVTYPVQDSKGNIFVGTGPQIYKIDPQTYTKSLIFTEPWGEYFSCLKIDEVGYIYASTVSKLYCLDGSGNRLWPQPFLLTQNQFFIEGIPAIDTIRNRVYTTYSDCETNQSYLASINRQTGLLVETRPDCAGVPSIGADGTIYVGGKSSLYALNPYYMGGSPLWTKPLGSSTVAFNTPVIGYDGTLYFSYKANISGSWHIKCEALAPSDGSTNWQEDLTANMYDNISQPYVSGNKVVVFTIKRHIGEGQYRFEIYAYRDASDHAEPLWTKNYNYSAGNLAFGPGATLYFWGQTGADREIYAISEGAKGDPEGAAMGWCNNTAPTIPSNPSPTNGANNIGPVATLSWDCTDANDLRYTVFLNQLDSGGVISSIATIENQTSYQLEGLKPSTAYAWKITATDGQAVTEGPTWVFSTKLPNPDLSGDDFVNFEDFAILASHWMETCSDPDYCQGADYYHDGQVDSKDLYYISENWLRYVPPDMVWVYINDPGVSSHEGFTGEISKYETTNAQYCLFLNVALASGDITVSGSTVYGANGSNSGADFVGQAYYNLAGSGLTYNGATNGGAARIHYSGSVFTVDSGFENHPITYVSWYGATAFCNYYGYRLPTQWEWQAVADYDGSFTYGCGTSINNGIANYLGSTHPDGTTVVGAFGMYGYGMCDMAGNVWEWTSSINSSGVCYVRGGSWHDPDEICSVSIWYYGGYPDGMNCLYGFRVCRNVEPSGMVWVYINDPGVSGHEGFTGYMSKYETTNAQYCQFLNAAKASNQITVYNNFVFATSDTSRSQPYYYLAGMGSNYGGATNGGAARIHYSSGVFSVDSGFENHPVSYVSWYGATAFCNYYGYRLPTEWEWQAVADYDGSYTYGCGTTINNSIANYVDSIHPDGTTIVGAFGTYGYGTCNMAGNVWEWTSSIYNGDHRVIRGGGWVDNGIDCTVSSRFHYSQQFMYISVGFRACR
jgi:formylglycine-generating enzyme required for sulfatase activity